MTLTHPPLDFIKALLANRISVEIMMAYDACDAFLLTQHLNTLCKKEDQYRPFQDQFFRMLGHPKTEPKKELWFSTL